MVHLPNMIGALAIEYLSKAAMQPSAAAYTLATLKKRAKSYKNSAKVLRQINSDKMEKCKFWKNFYDRSTFVATLILTFLGFYGVDKIYDQYLKTLISLNLVQLLFNLLILAVLIMTALQMAGRLGEKQVEHFGTVQRLTDFITDLDDLFLIESMETQDIKRRIKELNYKYKGITSSLPENSDKEWVAAKKKMLQKKLTSREIRAKHLFIVIRRFRRKKNNAR